MHYLQQKNQVSLSDTKHGKRERKIAFQTPTQCSYLGKSKVLELVDITFGEASDIENLLRLGKVNNTVCARANAFPLSHP